MVLSEPEIDVSLTSYSNPGEIVNEEHKSQITSYRQTFSTDINSLFFFQGKYVDFSAAFKVDNLGSPKTSGKGMGPSTLKQTYNAGVGLTFHSDKDALHLGMDRYDLQNAHNEPEFKKTYVGAKFMFQHIVGLAGGYYQGYPSYGILLDAFFFRMGLTKYTKEMGEGPGGQPRPMYVLTFSGGF